MQKQRDIEKEEGAQYGDLDKFYEQTLERTAKKTYGKLLSLLLVVLCTAIGYGAAFAINQYLQPAPDHIRYVRLAAIIIIGWSVLGRIGYETQTAGGGNPARAN